MLKKVLREYKGDIKYFIYFFQIKIQQIIPQIAVPETPLIFFIWENHYH